MSDEDDDDDDLMSHAADEPTAMWGGDMLEQLGLDRPPSDPPKGPAQPTAATKGSSVQVALDGPSAKVSAQPKRKRSAKRSELVQWVVLVGGALVLAAVAFFVVRALR